MSSLAASQQRRLLAFILSIGGFALLALGVHVESFLAVLAGATLLVVAAAARWRRVSFACALVAAALIATGAAEIVLRSGGPSEDQTLFSASYFDNRYFVRNDLGVLAKPGVHAIGKTARDGTVIYDVKYTIGADGFRVTPTPGNAGARRINFFGCSFTFGEGIGDDETLPNHIARLGGFEVRNFGFHGFGPHQALAILTSPRDTAGAINFYLAIPWQAERPACHPSWTLHHPRFVLENGVLRRAGECRPGTLGQSLVARIVSESTVLARIDDRLNSRARRDGWMELYLALLVEMDAISKRRSQEFVVGFIRADWTWDYGSYTDERLIAALRSKGIRVIDLTLADAERRLDPKYYIHPLDSHPTGVANRARAEMLLPHLR